MMRAGLLNKSITIQSLTETKGASGTIIETWAKVAEVHAQVIQASTEEYLRGYGEADAAAVIFRIRWIDNITTAHRVVYAGHHLNIREIKEIGRRNGLDLRCEEARS